MCRFCVFIHPIDPPSERRRAVRHRSLAILHVDRHLLHAATTFSLVTSSSRREVFANETTNETIEKRVCADCTIFLGGLVGLSIAVGRTTFFTVFSRRRKYAIALTVADETDDGKRGEGDENRGEKFDRKCR